MDEESATLAEMTSSSMTHAWSHAAAGARHDWWPAHYAKHWLMVAAQHVLGATAWTYQYPGAFFLDLNLGEVSCCCCCFFFFFLKEQIARATMTRTFPSA